MRDPLIQTFAYTLGELKKMIADVPCERCAEMPFDGAKHPGWVLAHLTMAAGMGASILQNPEQAEVGIAGVPEAYRTAGDADPVSTRDSYATKEELLAEFERVHALFSEELAKASDETMGKPFPNPDWRGFFPTIGHAAFYLMAHHEGYHLGQLSQWRRAAGFGVAGS